MDVLGSFAVIIISTISLHKAKMMREKHPANTVSFMLVGLITLFFKQSWNMNRKILSNRKDLEKTHLKLVHLSQKLEQQVIERTEMLTSSEHKCRRIFEQSLDTILVTDSQWKIIEINPADIPMSGYTKEEMVTGEMHINAHKDALCRRRGMGTDPGT